MNHSFNPYSTGTIAEYPQDTRADFIRKTYWHLAGALGVFALLETVFISVGLHFRMLELLAGMRFSWAIVLGGFMVVGWLASHMAHSATTRPMQYLALGIYTLAESIIFLPLIGMAIGITGSPVILGQAAVLTGAMVLGLTAIAFTTRKDFSFLGGILKIGGIIALGLIVVSIFTGFSLGLWFSLAMVVFASGAILYDTSKIMYHYQPGQHVAASLQLFASVALMLWYVLRILISLSGRD